MRALTAADYQLLRPSRGYHVVGDCVAVASDVTGWHICWDGRVFDGGGYLASTQYPTVDALRAALLQANSALAVLALDHFCEDLGLASNEVAA